MPYLAHLTTQNRARLATSRVAPLLGAAAWYPLLGLQFHPHRRMPLAHSRSNPHATPTSRRVYHTCLQVLPSLHACSPGDAEIVLANMRQGAPETDQAAVKAAFERNYGCLNISCADVGGLWATGIDDYYDGAGAPPEPQPRIRLLLSPLPSCRLFFLTTTGLPRHPAFSPPPSLSQPPPSANLLPPPSRPPGRTEPCSDGGDSSKVSTAMIVCVALAAAFVCAGILAGVNCLRRGHCKEHCQSRERTQRSMPCGVNLTALSTAEDAAAAVRNALEKQKADAEARREAAKVSVVEGRAPSHPLESLLPAADFSLSKV